MTIVVGLSNDASRLWALPASTEALTPRECNLAGRAQVTRRHTQVMACRAEKFGPIGAELFLCRSNQYNELEPRTDAPIAFKQSAGIPPHRYLLRFRIASAKALMAEPKFTLTEIALEGGFSIPNQFTAAFCRIRGSDAKRFSAQPWD